MNVGFRLAWLLSAVSGTRNHMWNAALLNVASDIYFPAHPLNEAQKEKQIPSGATGEVCRGCPVKLSSPFHLTCVCSRCFRAAASFPAGSQGWGGLCSTVLRGKCESSGKWLILEIRIGGTYRGSHELIARLIQFSLYRKVNKMYYISKKWI